MWSAWSSFQTTLRHFLVKVKQNKKFGYELCITVHYDSYENSLPSVVMVLYDLYENCLCELSLWCCMTCVRTACVSCHYGAWWLVWELPVSCHYSYDNCFCEVSLGCFMTRMRTVSVSCHYGALWLVWELFLWSIIRVLYDPYKNCLCGVIAMLYDSCQNCLCEVSLRCFTNCMRTVSMVRHYGA